MSYTGEQSFCGPQDDSNIHDDDQKFVAHQEHQKYVNDHKIETIEDDATSLTSSSISQLISSSKPIPAATVPAQDLGRVVPPADSTMTNNNDNNNNADNADNADNDNSKKWYDDIPVVGSMVNMVVDQLNGSTEADVSYSAYEKIKKQKSKKSYKRWDEKAISEWNHKNVISWVESMSAYQKYSSNFPKNMDGKELLDTTIDDLALIIPKKLWRRKFMRKIAEAKEKYVAGDGNEMKEETHGSHYNKNVQKVNGIVGLINLGNTCYMNTSIQILSQTPYITRYLKKRAKMNNKYGSNRKYPMLAACTNLCNIIYNQSPVSSYYSTPESPAAIRNALKKIDPEFGSGNQDDSSRSLGYMLQALDDEIDEEIVDNKKQQHQRKQIKQVYAQDDIKIFHGKKMTVTEIEETVSLLLQAHNPNNSILRKAFDGIEHVICECLECNKIFQQFVTFRITHLDVISHELTFKNIHIVCNDKCYQIPEIFALDYCSVDLIKYHVTQYLINETNEQLFCYNTEIIIISENGRIYNINNWKLSELQRKPGAMFVLIKDSKTKEVVNGSTLLQLTLTVDGRNEIKTKSASYSKYNPDKIHKLALSQISHKGYDYYFNYNGTMLSTKELKPKTFIKKMHNYGGVNVLITICVDEANQQYHYDIDDIDILTMYEATERYTGSKLEVLNKFKSWWSKRKDKASGMGGNETDLVEQIKNERLSKISATKMVLETKSFMKMAINAHIFTKFRFIIFDYQRLTSLIDCLKEYQKPKIFDQSSYAYPCPHCKSGSNSKFVKVTKKIVYSPPIFILHLDRYGKNGSFEARARSNCGPSNDYYTTNKFNHAINYQLQLNWSGITKSTRKIYNLYGISNHSGSTDGGHYSATIKCLSNGIWYDVSDSTINYGSIDGHSKSATILAYATNLE